MIKVFISYAHHDEYYKNELEKHLTMLQRNGHIDTWTDREIIAGDHWKDQIEKELNEADIILLLVSSDFLASDFCYNIEMKNAVKRHEKGKTIVIPVIIRYCDWGDTPFAKIQALPVDGKPVREWDDEDKAFFTIVDGIKARLQTLTSKINKDLSFGLQMTKSTKIAELRKKAFTAKNSWDLRQLKFEVSEYKKNNPASFEVEEIELLINHALTFENNNLTHIIPEKKKKFSGQQHHRPGCVVLVIVVLIATIVFAFI